MNSLIYILIPIILESLSDALQLRGLKEWSKRAKVLMIASWFVLLYFACAGQFPHYWKLPVLFVLWRIAFYNYVHNLVAWKLIREKLKVLYGREPKWYEIVLYIGDVDDIDRLVYLITFGTWWMLVLAQSVALVFSYFILSGRF
jgi:hypothetical protein